MARLVRLARLCVRSTLTCAALVMVAMGGSAASAQELTASFESEWQWFDKSQRPALSGQKVWAPVAWRGERLQRQILIEGAASHEGLSLSAEDLLHEAGALDSIPADAISFRFPSFVKGDMEARSCGGHSERGSVSWQSDALFAAPPSDAGNSLPNSGERYPFMVWVSIDVPRQVSHGRYAGAVTITDGQNAETRLRLSVRVADWRMPEVSERQFHLDLWQFPATVLDSYDESISGTTIDPWSADHLALLRPFYSYLAELGQRSATTYIADGSLGAPSMIEWVALDGGADWRFDYSAFDAYVENLFELGIDDQISAFSIAGWNAGTITYREAGSSQKRVLQTSIGSKSFNRIWGKFLSDFRKHLEGKGWFERTVLYLDELPSDQVEHIIRLVRSDHADWKVGLAFGHQPSKRVVESLYDRSGNFGIHDRFKLRDAHHRVTTFYTSCTQIRPNTYVAADASPVDMAAIPWYAFSQRLDGYLHWAYENWKNPDPLDPRDGPHTAGDFSLVYRSDNGAGMTLVPSVRSELLRDGIEDYEKLAVLRSMGLVCDGSCAPMRLLVDGPQGCRAREVEAAVEAFTVSRLEAGDAENLVRRARDSIDDYSTRVSAHDCAPLGGR